jgi:hypothetical protein
MKWDILTHIFGTGNDIQRRNLNVYFFYFRFLVLSFRLTDKRDAK